MWRCLLLACLLVRCFPVTGPSLLCSSAVALLVCRWSIVGLLESVLLSCRCPVAVLSLSCRCPVAGLPLVYRWSTAGLSARVRGRSSISSVAGLSARVGVADASLMCRWSVSALSLFCRYSARVMVAVTGLSLVHRCHWSAAGSSLLCHWSVAGSSLSLVCRWFIAVTGLSLVHHCSVTGSSLSLVCRWFIAVTGLSLVHRCHWSVAGSSLLCSGHSRWSWSLIVRHSCATALPVPLSAGLSLLSLTCLLEPWSLIRRLSAARLPLVHLIVHRYSSARCSVCLSITGPSLLRLLARRLSVCSSVAFLSACLSAGPSLVCLLVRRCSSVAARPLLTHCWSACLSITGCHCPVPVRGRWSVSSSVSSRLLVRLLVHRSSLVRRWSVAGPLLVRLLVHRSSLVGLLGSGSLPRGWSAARLSLTRGWSWSLVRLLVHHWPVCSSVAFLSAVRSPVCLLEPWSLARRSSICCPSLLRLLES